MPSRAALTLAAAGFLLTVLAWALLPGITRTLETAHWVELPEDDDAADGALAILEAQAEAEKEQSGQADWLRAAGEMPRSADEMLEAPVTTE